MHGKRLFDRIDSISISGVTKQFGDVVAVDDLSLDVRGGELLILIGGSGSGKTTMLRMINRLIDPDSGSIAINGTETTTLDPIALRKNIGYVIQQIGLFPHMTIRDNIGLLPKIEGWSNDRIDERVRELLARVHLSPDLFMDRYPKELSGGQQQRIGLARALVMDPPLLLMDEPFGALDPILRRQLQDDFLGIKADIGKTIVFVTHDINEAFRLGDRIAIMDEGRLIQVGAARDLILNPADQMVSGLVGSDHLYRHLENLTVRDLMQPAADLCHLQATCTLGEAIARMQNPGAAIAILTDGVASPTIVRMADLLQGGDNSAMVGSYACSPLILEPDEPALPALTRMKSGPDCPAVVAEGRHPVGLLTPDMVVRKLV
ncbi:MAG: ATP-binding cassette domain-containing protein [Methanocalculus sp. MSAO_Arc1]|uniref:ABC transporter ATP-binding protein n=1 Tax=Methanocalculus TaxID=71151 RepID=UPI000FEF0060|nr:ATP-binding cassette domain-containing protein [Methanocalculus sp. MSAO_Arc1]MCP1661705.1 osmoprotectant transport system ATP-binding protein [Methanocalculus sp. AMF5]RQD80500.1 MAG: ATP-binding cassette domain-containing protein [Methanocalculus sp. MSAO_Arc1]